MSLWKIAWRSIQERALASGLTALSLALGVALVVTVLVVHHVVDRSFRRSAQGYNLIVGAPKGSGLELVLSTVYHLGQPIENIPYTYWLEFTRGRFAADVEAAIPVSIGDNYRGFHVVGTVPEMFTKLRWLDDRPYTFAEGRNLDPEHLQEAVAGWQAAEQTGLKLGDPVRPSHGLSGEGGHEHEPFKVVGILSRTGTPADRALYVNIEAVYRLEGHLRPKSHDAQAHDHKDTDHHHDHGAAAHGHAHDHAIPDEDKQVTAILVAAKPTRVMALARRVNDESVARAAIPVQEISRLLDGIVGNVQVLLLILAVLVVVVAGIGMLVSIYNSMNDRRREIAVMRALGARRRTVMLVVLMESVLLSAGGGLLGLALGHALLGLLSPLVLQQTGVMIDALRFQWDELVLIPGLLALAALIGYLPAAVAYRTDVAKALSASQ